MIKAVLFDLDGTLADTAPDLAYALNCVREARGLPPLPLSATRPYASHGARGLIGAGLPGSLIQISSQMGHVGGPKRAVYCATKHAVEGMTRALAWELGPHQIRANTVCPTFIETAMTRPALADPEFRQFVTSRIALGRLGQLEDIMGAVVFLASDASAMVTGSALMVDGGWTAQ